MPREQAQNQETSETGVGRFYKTIKPTLTLVNNIAGIYLVWIILHFVAAHLYVYYCANLSFYGFLMSPILVSAPHCRAIRWTIYNGAQSIDTMWIVFGTWLCSRIALIGG